MATLTLNRTVKLNAIDEPMQEELMDALSRVGADDETNVLVITGAGRAFSAGIDLSQPFFQLGDKDTEAGGLAQARFVSRASRYLYAVHELPQVTIASVNGVCAGGGGFGLAMACDMRLASDQALFWMVPNQAGLIQDLGLTWFLQRVIGTAKTCELLFTGDRVDGMEAARIGLVNKTVPHDRLEEATRELAEKVAAGAPFSLRQAKKSLYRGLSLSLKEQLESEAVTQGLIMTTEDAREGLAAFREKRKPAFKGK